jgi:hypothetical protein
MATKKSAKKAPAKKAATRKATPPKKSSASSKKSSSKKTAKKAPAKKAGSARTLIEPHAGDKRYIRRDAKGRIKESVDVGRSLAADRRQKAKTKAKHGQGDKGD